MIRAKWLFRSMALVAMAFISTGSFGAAEGRVTRTEARDCYICRHMEMSSCDDWQTYDLWCGSIGCGLAVSCTSNGCAGGAYKIECSE